MTYFQHAHGRAYSIIFLLLALSLTEAIALTAKLSYPRLLFIEHRNERQKIQQRVDSRISSVYTDNNGTHFQETYRIPENSYITPDTLAVDKESGRICLSHQSYSRGEIL
jgi:hypothetical protein